MGCGFAARDTALRGFERAAESSQSRERTSAMVHLPDNMVVVEALGLDSGYESAVAGMPLLAVVVSGSVYSSRVELGQHWEP